MTGFIGITIRKTKELFWKLEHLYRSSLYRPRTLTSVLCAQDFWEIAEQIQDSVGDIYEHGDVLYALNGVRHVSTPVYDNYQQYYVVYATYDLCYLGHRLD